MSQDPQEQLETIRQLKVEMDLLTIKVYLWDKFGWARWAASYPTAISFHLRQVGQAFSIEVCACGARDAVERVGWLEPRGQIISGSTGKEAFHTLVNELAWRLPDVSLSDLARKIPEPNVFLRAMDHSLRIP